MASIGSVNHAPPAKPPVAKPAPKASSNTNKQEVRAVKEVDSKQAKASSVPGAKGSEVAVKEVDSKTKRVSVKA